MGSKEFSIIIKCVFILLLILLLIDFLYIILRDFKWGFYVLSLAKTFIAVGIMITFYLGLTLKKEPSSDNKDTFWA
jgi:uncharacterized ion transporter superfamily protein YfcC